MPMARPGIAAFVAGLGLGAGGCLDSFTSRSLRPGHLVETPKLSDPSIQIAARVDEVGRDLLSATPFFPVDPTFHTAAVKEVFITHPDLTGVLVSEGLVRRCQSEAELAAVLAAELGQMAAEKRAADRLRSGTGDPPPDPRAAAEELLTAAGYTAKDLDAVAPLLAESDKNRKLTSSLSKKLPAPTWSP
jgi:hypothetical protein